MTNPAAKAPPAEIIKTVAMDIGNFPSALVAIDRVESIVAVRLSETRVNDRMGISDVANVVVSLVTVVLDMDMTTVSAGVVAVVATVDKLGLAAVVVLAV